MLFGFDETWLVEIARKHVSKGDVVFDVGAHIGYTSLLFAKLVGQQGEVHAFELLPTVAEKYLSKSIKANHLEKNIIVHPVGLSDKQEELTIHVGETMMGNLDRMGYESAKVEKCKTETLDSYMADYLIGKPNLIKVDVERAEIQFLEGARSTIEKYKPKLIIEFHNADLLKQGCQLLRSMDYQVATKDGILTSADLECIYSFYGNVLATPKS